MTERTRASAVDVSGFKAPARAPVDKAALDQLAAETPFASRAGADPAVVGSKRGRPTTGPKTIVYARLPAAHYSRLQRLRDEKGWSLVTALERAVDALGEREGVV